MGWGFTNNRFRSSRPRIARAWRALSLVVAALGACSMFDKDVVIPDEPADKLYNEGLFLLNNKKDAKNAAKKFEEVDRQHPYSEWARKSLIMTAYANYEAGNYDDTISAAKRYVALAPGQPGRGLCAIPDRIVLFRPDRRKSRVTRAAPNARSRRSKRLPANIRAPNTPPRPSARSRSPAISSPARRWTSRATT